MTPVLPDSTKLGRPFARLEILDRVNFRLPPMQPAHSKEATRLLWDVTRRNWRVCALFWGNRFHHVFLHKIDYLRSCTSQFRTIPWKHFVYKIFVDYRKSNFLKSFLFWTLSHWSRDICCIWMNSTIYVYSCVIHCSRFNKFSKI